LELPRLRQLVGAAVRARRGALFFSTGGYTAKAVEYATATNVKLYKMRFTQGQAQMSPQN